MEVKFTTQGKTLIAAVTGELDQHCAASLREQTDLRISHTNIKRLIFDLSSLEFMDSSGIGLVMGRYKICESMGASLEIHGLSRHAYKVMCLAGLQNLAVLKKKKEAEKSETA